MEQVTWYYQFCLGLATTMRGAVHYCRVRGCRRSFVAGRLCWSSWHVVDCPVGSLTERQECEKVGDRVQMSAEWTRKLLMAVVACRVKSVTECAYCFVEQPSQSVKLVLPTVGLCWLRLLFGPRVGSGASEVSQTSVSGFSRFILVSCKVA